MEMLVNDLRLHIIQLGTHKSVGEAVVALVSKCMNCIFRDTLPLMSSIRLSEISAPTEVRVRRKIGWIRLFYKIFRWF